MGDLSGSVSIDVERIFFGGKEHRVETRCGTLSVSVYGDEDKPALITYPDVALNYMSCFQGFFFCPESASLLLHNFCVYHITPQGHELGAVPIPPDVPVPSVDDLADQVADVLDFFSLGSVMCLGVTAGAYVLTLFATKYRERVLGLMLVSPLCKTPSWSEWLYNKVLLNLLYYYGTRGLVKESLLQRYFSTEVRGNGQDPESEIVQACRSLLHERQVLPPLHKHVAERQGKYLARQLSCVMEAGGGHANLKVEIDVGPPFVSTVGRGKALVDLRQSKESKGISLAGFLSFFIWRSAYLTRVISWRNRLYVFINRLTTVIFGRGISRI